MKLMLKHEMQVLSSWDLETTDINDPTTAEEILLEIRRTIDDYQMSDAADGGPTSDYVNQ